MRGANMQRMGHKYSLGCGEEAYRGSITLVFSWCN